MNSRWAVSGTVYRFTCPCGRVFEGPAAGVAGDRDVATGRFVLEVGDGAGEVLVAHLGQCEQGRVAVRVSFV